MKRFPHLIYRLAAVAALIMAGAVPARAIEFFSTDQPEQRLELGVRFGINTSVHTMSGLNYDTWNREAWGAGVTAGVVAAIAFRDYIAIQPGLFVNYRSGSYSRVSQPPVGDTFVGVGNTHSFDFQVPVMVSVRFNVLDELRWSVDAGPCLDLLAAASDRDRTVGFMSDGRELEAKRNIVGMSLKLGTGLTLNERWYAGVHYLAGLSKVWDNDFGGHNKAWQFTLGYYF